MSKKISTEEPFGESETIRRKFPSLGAPTIFLDNAGGSQLPLSVVERQREYLVWNYVQLGADYEIAKRSTSMMAEARDFMKVMMNAQNRGEVIFGASSSALIAMLADCYARAPRDGKDEIVVAEEGHEANVGPWMRLKDRGFNVKLWKFDIKTQTSPLEMLDKLLTPHTRLVALPHVSNLLGTINDVKTICEKAHKVGAKVMVDGVAFAPHRAVDVIELGVDWYVLSNYKMYAPHMASMFGTHEAMAQLEGPNHYFINKKDVPYKFELGGINHEGCAGLLGLREYLCFLADEDSRSDFDRSIVEKAFKRMEERENPLIERLLNYLTSKPNVKIVGAPETGKSRVGTVSFVVPGKTSKQIVIGANEQNIGIRYGHFYAHRLTEALDLNPDDGVVRTSLVHYNTIGEIETLIEYFEKIL